MNDAYFSLTKRLDDKIPPHIPWLTNAQVCQVFEISDATRRRECEVLRMLKVSGFPSDWKNRKGYNRQALEALWEFIQLKQLTDRSEAIDKIKPLMEALYARKGQRARATCQR
ncbi:hypothetical protein [Floridanema evergladense]|uniref:LAGLIDADG homing endonuclease n=1 Tax=Floridaenema evergladense BLCC-F167 TaxID=3153639 RepID=A0ABV4WKB1_9CYAN